MHVLTLAPLWAIQMLVPPVLQSGVFQLLEYLPLLQLQGQTWLALEPMRMQGVGYRLDISHHRLQSQRGPNEWCQQDDIDSE